MDGSGLALRSPDAQFRAFFWIPVLPKAGTLWSWLGNTDHNLLCYQKCSVGEVVPYRGLLGWRAGKRLQNVRVDKLLGFSPVPTGPEKLEGTEEKATRGPDCWDAFVCLSFQWACVLYYVIWQFLNNMLPGESRMSWFVLVCSSQEWEIWGEGCSVLTQPLLWGWECLIEAT